MRGHRRGWRKMVRADRLGDAAAPRRGANRRIRLLGGPAAVDDDRLPGHMSPRVADEPQDRTRKVVEAGVRRERRAALQPRPEMLVLVQLFIDLAAEETRGERVHPDAVPGPLHSQFGGEPRQALLAGGVRGLREPGDADSPTDRRYVNDRSPPSRDHVREDGLGQPERRDQVEVECLAYRLERFNLGRFAAEDVARHVYQDLSTAQLGGDLREE